MNSRRTKVVCGARLRELCGPILEELGAANRQRLESLLPLFAADKTALSDCLNKLYPNATTADALALFRAFRKAVNDAAQERASGLTLSVDSRKKNPPEERHCWFQAPDTTEEAIENFSRAGTADIDRAREQGALIAARAVPTRGTALARDRRPVRFFVSYAHAQAKVKEKLLELLEEQFGPSLRYRYYVWADGMIEVGAPWHGQIQAALQGCDFGLLLVSPAFLDSNYISEHELPQFVRGAKPMIPVCLARVNLKRHDLKGLESSQIFFLKNKSFHECKTAQERRRFVEALFQKIEERLDGHFGGAPPAAASLSLASAARSDPSRAAQSLAECLPGEKSEKYVPSRGAPYGLRDLEKLDLTQGVSAERGVDALDFLEAWATDGGQPPFCAVLGEYGIGKTTTLKQLTHRLLDKRRKDATSPLPIFVDLREYVSGTGVPTLENILAGVIRRNWKSGGTSSLAPADIIDMVQRHGALILFDGLDEKIVHLPPVQAQAFIRQLWRVLPPYASKAKAGGGRRGKMLLSCRSHYFKDVWDQNAMLTGEDRDDIRAGDYRACILLPFNEEQVRAYLRGVRGSEADAQAALDLFASVHNLSELAGRPYLLSVMADEIDELERQRARGEKVLGVSLYDLLITRWLKRDNGKHHFSDTHKREMMEHLAAALWRDRAREWPWERVERWLDEFLHERPDIAGRYTGKPPEVLNEDLRTATFVLRPDNSPDQFRFAHTSLQEYFLARYLCRALEEGRGERWQMDLPSRETLDFLGQMLELQGERAPLKALAAVLEGDHRKAARLAFAYWVMAAERGYPEPAPTRANLAGLDLEGWTIRGPAGRRLALATANLAGACLDHARLEDVDLGSANLGGASGRLAEFLRVSLQGAQAAAADFTGAVFRECDGRRLQGSDAEWWDTEWIRSDLGDANLEGRIAARGSLAVCHSPGGEGSQPVLPPAEAVPVARDGHSAAVNCCAWSPDGARLLSVSDDGTLRVWDSASGRELLTLQGHTNWVRACAWSPDSARLLSGSYDQTLRVWDSASGRELLTLQGHTDWVRACAWSPDGARLLSASDDQTLRVWDAGSGRTVLTLQGHTGLVLACAWSPDGARLLSASADRTLRVWDASSGRALLTLQGHTGQVQSCAWSPDGARLLSGSNDQTLRVWDAGSGRELLTLQGHTGLVLACAWSPDGAHLLSASADRTLRVWDAGSGRALLTFQGHTGLVQSCAWSPDGTRLLSASFDATLRVWDAQSGRALLALQGHMGWVWACAWSPDGARLLSGSDDRTLRVWDAQSGRAFLTLEGHAHGVLACAWSPDGARLLSGSSDKTLRVWDAQSGRALLALQGHTGWVRSCAWSPDGARLLSGSTDGTLRVWDAQSGRALLTLEGHAHGVLACAWSPDGTRLLSGSDDRTLQVWDAQNGRALLTLEGHAHGVLACAWSPDGTRLLSGSADRTLRVWDAESGRALLTLEGHAHGVQACAWSPDGTRLLSGSADGTLRVWDAASGCELLALRGHAGGVRACAWSPDGALLLSASDDGTLRLWDAHTGALLSTSSIWSSGEAATIDHRTRRISWASPGAWRHLGWRVHDPQAGRIRILPAEFFGPLPE
jgi:WD40 repeat protein